MSGDALSVDIRHRINPALEIEARFSVGVERLVLFGPSGSGKSTLLRLIAGLERPSAGRVELDGVVLDEPSIRRHLRPSLRRVGLIFQEDRLFPHLNVAGNLRFGLSGRRKEIDDRVREVAALCGVSGLLDRLPSTLSGGERQRVGLARSMAPRPRLLLCDEPVSALDMNARYQLLDRLKQVQEVERIPLLYVTHSPSEALALGTRMLRWEAGRVVESGRPLDLLAGRTSGELFENVWSGTAVASEHDESVVRLDGGLKLFAPRLSLNPGARLTVRVRADEIILAHGPVAGVSARNLLPGRVDRLIDHEGDTHVLVACEGSVWVVVITQSATRRLGLEVGMPVQLLVKARSVHVSES